MPKKTAATNSPGVKMLIPPLSVKRLTFWAVGDTPLIVHAWDPQSREDMLRKQMGSPTRKKAPKDPQKSIDQCFYMTSDGKYGFDGNAFKQAAVGACRYLDAKMTEARGTFFVLGGILPIYGANPVAREDMVRVGMGTADLRYRPMFEEWAVQLTVEYDATMMGPDQVVNLFNRAGMAPGIGEWRPEKNGNFGRFHVEDKEAAAKWLKRVPKVGSCRVDDLLSRYDSIGVQPAIGDAE